MFPLPLAAFLLGACAAVIPPAVDAQAAYDPFRAPADPADRSGSSPAESSIDRRGPRGVPPVVFIGPYAGLPLSDTRIQPAIGAHVEWTATKTLSLAVRYEWRINESEPGYGCASADAVRRLAGTDTVALAFTGGWARWQGQDRGTVGMRFRGPMVTMAGGSDALVEFWADVRYAFGSAHDVARLDGRLWAAVMLVVPLNVVFRS